MERDTNQMSQSPSLCRSGCGFYGNPSSDGLCSKCYKDALKRKQAAPTASSTTSSSSLSVDNSSNIKTLIAASASISSVSSNVSAISAQDEPSHSSAEAKVESNEELPKVIDIIESTSSEAPKTQKKKKTKCAKCRANVGVISFPCRCGGIYCGTHRYASEHNCTFDYKEHGAEEIRKNNPQIIGEKVQKI